MSDGLHEIAEDESVLPRFAEHLLDARVRDTRSVSHGAMALPRVCQVVGVATVVR